MKQFFVKSTTGVANFIFVISWLVYLSLTFGDYSLVSQFCEIMGYKVQQWGHVPVFRWEVALAYTAFFYYAYRQYFYNNANLGKRLVLLFLSAILLAGSVYCFNNLYYFDF